MRDLYSEVDAARLRLAGISPQSAGKPPRLPRQVQAALHPAGGRRPVRDQDVRRARTAGFRRTSHHDFSSTRGRHIQDAVVADFRIGKHEAFVRKAVALSAHSR